MKSAAHSVTVTVHDVSSCLLSIGPTIGNLSFLLQEGGGCVLSGVAAVVAAVNSSLDRGLRVTHKRAPPSDEVRAVLCYLQVV